MPTFSLDENEARRRLSTNPHARWFKDGIDPTDPSGDYAVQRLATGVFLPSVPASDLRISPDDRLFAIGSCFARGIELAMLQAGFDVPSYASEFNDFELANDQVTGRGFTNKYTTFAIENEIRWALDPEAEFPTASLVETDDGTVIDPHTNPTLKWVDRANTLDRRETIGRVYSRLAQSRVVVMTLGLVETWFDTEAGVYLNMTPSPAMMQASPGRYRFEVTDFAQNRDAVERTGEVLRKYGHPDCQIVVTVSPVPLMATFSGQDVVVANSFSKSVLRAVAGDWSAAQDNVHYFPSYEIVTGSERGLAWEADGRHVQGPIVQQIMALFRATFVPTAS